jgi:hypothetical protein
MAAVEHYLRLRRTTGFDLSTAESLLASFARFAAERNERGGKSAGRRTSTRKKRLTSSLRPQLNSAHAARCGLTLTRLCLHCWLAPDCESPRRWACDLPISRLMDC